MNKIFLLSTTAAMLLTAAALSAQDSIRRQITYGKNTLTIGTDEIPLYPGAENIQFIEYTNGTFDIYYSKYATSISAMNKDKKAIVKLYSGKTIYGAIVGSMKDNGTNRDEFKSCGDHANLHIEIGPDSGAYKNGVNIRSYCAQNQ